MKILNKNGEEKNIKIENGDSNSGSKFKEWCSKVMWLQFELRKIIIEKTHKYLVKKRDGSVGPHDINDLIVNVFGSLVCEG